MSYDEFTAAQVHAMEKSVYIDSEKFHRNLRLDECGRNTDDYFIHWIENHSKEFRDAWDISVCKSCKKVNTCYNCLKEVCPNYDHDEVKASVFEMRQEFVRSEKCEPNKRKNLWMKFRQYWLKLVEKIWHWNIIGK